MTLNQWQLCQLCIYKEISPLSNHRKRSTIKLLRNLKMLQRRKELKSSTRPLVNECHILCFPSEVLISCICPYFLLLFLQLVIKHRRSESDSHLSLDCTPQCTHRNCRGRPWSSVGEPCCPQGTSGSWWIRTCDPSVTGASP